MTSDDVTLLVIDDESAIADAYARWLQDRYRVQTAHTGTEALEKIDESIDIVLLDRRLPDISGEALLEELLEREIDCRVAIISSVEPDFDIIDMGFDLYLEKPVPNSETLHEAVATLVRRSRFNAQMQEYLSLASKKAVLETRKNVTDLAGNQEYRELVDQISDLRERLESITADLDEEDLRVEFSRQY